MKVCPPEISWDLATVREKIKNWACLKAPKDLDNGLKTKFCHFIREGTDELMS